MRIRETFGNRRVTISEATENDFVTYKEQLNTLWTPTKDRLAIIEEDKAIYYLKVNDRDGKLIGLIQISEIDSKTAYFKVSIPNKSWELRYGTETVHQFVKWSLQNKPYNRIYFKENDTVCRYKSQRPEMFTNNNYYIDIA